MILIERPYIIVKYSTLLLKSGLHFIACAERAEAALAFSETERGHHRLQ